MNVKNSTFLAPHDFCMTFSICLSVGAQVREGNANVHISAKWSHPFTYFAGPFCAQLTKRQ